MGVSGVHSLRWVWHEAGPATALPRTPVTRIPSGSEAGLSRKTQAARGTSILVAVILGVGALLAATLAGAATAPGLGTAGSFAVLAGAGVTNTGPTVINGNLGTWPTPAISGFPPGVVNGTIHAADAVAMQAQSDLTTAYNSAAAQAPTTTYPGPTDLGGLTLTPGVYNTPTSFAITGALTLDAQGDPSAVFVFQAGSTLITASNSSVALINGAQACNVFWQVGSSATLGVSSAFIGSILALTSITANTNARVAGRLLARNGATTLDSNRVTRPVCAVTTTTTTSSSTSSSSTTSTTTGGSTTSTTSGGSTTSTTSGGSTTSTTSGGSTTSTTSGGSTTSTTSGGSTTSTTSRATTTTFGATTTTSGATTTTARPSSTTTTTLVLGGTTTTSGATSTSRPGPTITILPSNGPHTVIGGGGAASGGGGRGTSGAGGRGTGSPLAVTGSPLPAEAFAGAVAIALGSLMVRMSDLQPAGRRRRAWEASAGRGDTNRRVRAAEEAAFRSELRAQLERRRPV
jgi:hypothetical protein